jgi:hypothetical protein
MNSFVQDLRYALRQLGKHRGFTGIAVLALAIGANTAIFSVVNGVLLSPLPFPNGPRIVSMFGDKPDFPKGSISYPNFLDWQRENRAFAAIAAYRSADGSITGAGEPEDLKAQRISATFFPILGVTPIRGRNFTAEEDQRGANPTVMISCAPRCRYRAHGGAALRVSIHGLPVVIASWISCQRQRFGT